MKEELIKFKTADLAEEKGYPFKYITTEEIRKVPLNIPTQSLLQKWLREEYDLDVYIIPNGSRDKSVNKRLYHPIIWVRDEYNTELHSSYSYEEALEKGLQEALKLI